MAYLSNTVVGGSLRVLNGLYANTLSGNGSALTALNASNISSGTLAKERLATSGATAGSYGPSAAVTGNEGTTMNVPYITVDTYGRITAISNKVYTAKNTVYTHPNSGATAGSYGPSDNASPAHGAGFSVPYMTINAAGHVTAASTKTITLPAQYVHPTGAGNNHIPAGGSSGQILKWSAAGTATWAAEYSYTHPTTSGNKHIPSGGSSGQILRWSADGTAAWGADNNTTYSAGTTAQLVTGTDTTNRVYTPKVISDYVRPRAVEFIAGTQTAATGSFTGVTTDDALYDGKTIFYYLPYAGSGNATLNLTLSNGTSTTGAKAVYLTGNTRLTTHYGAGSCFHLTYRSSDDSWHSANYDSNSNTYDRRLHNNNIKAAAAITAGTVIVGTSAGYKTAASGITFDITYPILYASAAIASGATAANTYECIPGLSLATTKSGWTGTQYAMAYLVGTLSGTTVTIDSAVFTTTAPTSADSKVYIPIGVTYSTTQVFFAPTKDIYQYTNGSFHLLDTTTAATGGTNGTIKINGTEVAVKGLGTGAYAAAYTHPNSGATAGSYGPSADASPAHGAGFSVPYVTINAAGHVTAASTKTITLPAQYVHPTGAGNNHIPAGGSSGQILKWSAAGTATWAAEYSYTHPTTSGNKHIPSGGSSGQILRWSADGTAAWGADNNTTYSAVTTSANGLMTSTDKTKLNKIAQANYGGTGNTTKIKININSTTTWMMSFVVTLYQGYVATKVMISGYQYGTNHWYNPTAIILGGSGTAAVSVYFGYDDTNKLWVGFDGGSYTGVSIDSVCNGYTQIDDYSDLFTITNVSSLTTLQTTVSAKFVQMTTAPTSGQVVISDGTGGGIKTSGYTIATSVPSGAKFTDTVYTHPNSGATAGSYGPSDNASPAHGAGFSVPYLTINAAGHVTAASTKTITLPAQYTHPTDAGNNHIPAGGSSGQILKWSAAGTATWAAEYSYTHPTTSGNKHIPSGGSANQVLVYSADGTAAWGAVPSHTHSGYLTAHQTIKQDAVTGATGNRYGACGTAAATAAKTVSITAGTPALEAGLKVTVKFTNANTAGTPTLNVNSLGAKNIFHNGAQITTGANKALLAGVCDFVYDGTQFHLVGNYIDTNTVYTHPTGAGNNHIPAGGSSGQILKWSAAGTATWAAEYSYTHPNTVTAGTVGTSSATSGSTLAVPYITYNANGHITATGTHTHTVTGFLTAHQTIKQDGISGATVKRFGECSTAAATAAKTVSVGSGTVTLETGLHVIVKFTNAITVASATLNVNSTGAKDIQYRGAALPANVIAAGMVAEFVYDGIRYQLIGNWDVWSTD